MAIKTPEELLRLLQKGQVLQGDQLRQAQAAVRQGDDAKTLAGRLVAAGLLTEGQAAQATGDLTQPWAGSLPSKRKPPVAQSLPTEDGEESGIGDEEAAEKSKFLETPQQKIIAGAAGAMGLTALILLGILVPRLFRSGDSSKDSAGQQDASWVAPASTKGGEPTEESSPPPSVEQTPSPPAPDEPNSLGYGFQAERNPMGVDLGVWYTTGQIPSKGYSDSFFPEEGIDLEAKDENDKPLWVKVPDMFDGVPNMLPAVPNSTTYMFRTVTAKRPTTLHAGFGSDDTLDVWLNGKKVVALETYRAVDVDTERAYLRLNVGENELLLKIRNGGGEHGYSFDAHLADARETGADEVSADVGAPTEGDVAVKAPAADPTVAPGESPDEPAEPAPAEGKEPPAKRPLSTVGNLATLNLDEKSGRLFDLSGKNHHGTVRGSGVTYNQPGKHGGALGFDGSGGDIVLEGSEEYDFSSDFTWTAWIKTWGDGTIVAYTAPDGDCRPGMKALHVRDGKLAFEVGWHGVVGGRTRINDDKWHHVALSVKANVNDDRDKATLYVDGKAETWKEDWKVDAHVEGSDFVLKVGRCNKNFGWDKFKGSIDGVTVWNRTLDAEEIASTGDAQHNPFGVLGQSGNLEPYGKAAMPPEFHTLGKLSLTPEATVNLMLVGGRQAVAAPRYLEIAQGKDGKQWVVCFCTPTRAGEPTKTPVAQIVIKDQELRFQWARGVASGKANGLLNCGLDVSVDGRTMFLPLGQPTVVKPLAVNLQTGVTKSILSAGSLPPRESLRLEVVRVEGFPKPQFSPGDTLVPGEATDISFDPETFPKLWLHLAFDVKTRPALELTTKIDYQIENTAFRTFQVKEAEQLMVRYRQQAQKLMQDMQKNLRDEGKVNHYKNELKKLEAPVARLMRLSEVCKGFKEKPGVVHFRIRTVIDEQHEIPLMQSFPPEKPGASE